MPEWWSTGTVLKAVEDIPLDDWDYHGNQTVILQGARTTVGPDRLSIPPTNNGFCRFPYSGVRHPFAAPIWNVSFLWHNHKDQFKVVE
jgi:hypothetical protein